MTDDAGIMLNKDFETGELVSGIEFFLNLPADQVEKYRKNAFGNWKSRYDASLNYGNFARQLELMLTNIVEPDNSKQNEI